MVQSYDGFKPKTTFFVFFFLKACDRDTILRQIEGKAFKSVAKKGYNGMQLLLPTGNPQNAQRS